MHINYNMHDNGHKRLSKLGKETYIKGVDKGKDRKRRLPNPLN